MTEILFQDRASTPIGDLRIFSSNKGIRYIGFEDSHKAEFFDKYMRDSKIGLVHKENEHIKQLKAELIQYFKKEITSFNITHDMVGTEFQLKVWNSLSSILYGETWNYLQQASSLNNPKAVRAVASANGRNPLCIILPCHRVIGSNGKLTGYAGGIERKKFLLNLENPILSFNLEY